MKKLIYILILTFVPVSISSGVPGNVFDSLRTFRQGVREVVNITSTTALPDSVLVTIVQRALIFTSVDAGGYEKIFRFPTVDATAFYALEDSITEVLHVTVMSEDNRITTSIQSFDPEFFEDIKILTKLEDGDAAVPRGYTVFADTIQLIPAPVRVDSVFLKCFYEHPAFTDSLIHLKPAFAEAALMYACSKVYEHRKMFNEATFYMNLYEALRNKLRIRYAAKFGAKTGEK